MSRATVRVPLPATVLCDVTVDTDSENEILDIRPVQPPTVETDSFTEDNYADIDDAVAELKEKS